MKHKKVQPVGKKRNIQCDLSITKAALAENFEMTSWFLPSEPPPYSTGIQYNRVKAIYCNYGVRSS